MYFFNCVYVDITTAIIIHEDISCLIAYYWIQYETLISVHVNEMGSIMIVITTDVFTALLATLISEITWHYRPENISNKCPIHCIARSNFCNDYFWN